MAVIEEPPEGILKKAEKTKDNSDDVEAGDSSDILREERRSTGRALATGVIIFIVVVGLYHAVVYGRSGLSALMGGFIIMILYVASLLYAAHRKRKLQRSNEAALEREIEEVIVNASKSAKKSPEKKRDCEESQPTDRPVFIRTYSIA
ncbi:uncharacterized protein LOC126889447 [Diabrotica virgifera virgifera]|uniref:Uncharacterized protein LOC114340875 n=1 Tax=Diabrotica virgifera virgifera TaxID=50390 RepID=A0A6P7GUD8_DIAVI|nr:uncharacterized protein LOC126889447 [Diabrotica virgifera virgifera]